MKDRLTQLKIEAMSVFAAIMLAACGSAEMNTDKVEEEVVGLGGTVLDIDTVQVNCKMPWFVLPRIPVGGPWQDMSDVIWYKHNSLRVSLGKLGQSVGDDVWVVMSEPNAQASGYGYDLQELHPNKLRNIQYLGDTRVFAYGFTLGGEGVDCTGKVKDVKNFMIRQNPAIVVEMDQKSRKGMVTNEIDNPPPPPGNSLPGEKLTAEEEAALAQGVIPLGLIKSPRPSLVPAGIMDPNNTGVIPGCEVYTTVRVDKRLYAPQGVKIIVNKPEETKYECKYNNGSHEWQEQP